MIKIRQESFCTFSLHDIHAHLHKVHAHLSEPETLMQLPRTCDFLGLLDIRVKHIIDWQASLVKESSLTRRKRRIQLSLRERFQADRVDDNGIAVCVYPLTADNTN